MANVDVVTDWW